MYMTLYNVYELRLTSSSKSHAAGCVVVVGAGGMWKKEKTPEMKELEQTKVLSKSELVTFHNKKVRVL